MMLMDKSELPLMTKLTEKLLCLSIKTVTLTKMVMLTHVNFSIVLSKWKILKEKLNVVLTMVIFIVITHMNHVHALIP
jgi:hypothetical protein